MLLEDVRVQPNASERSVISWPSLPMADDPDWVLLVECNDLAELHTLRASLEAHGIPCQVHGEHTHGILGPIQGAMIRPRVLVPRRALVHARELAEDVVGPFDEVLAEDDAADGEAPYRVAAAPVPAERERPAPSVRPKSYAALVLVAFVVLPPLFGVSHLYVGRNTRAGILAAISVFAIAASFHGVLWTQAVLGMVWVLDLVGGAVGIAAHNRTVKALQAADDEGDEDDEDE